MVVFDIKSACYISRIFESENLHFQNGVFFNDGIKNRQVTGIKELNQKFEANGMFQSIFTGYRLFFEDGCEVEVDVLNSNTKFISKENKLKPNKSTSSSEPKNLNDWVEAGINDVNVMNHPTP